MMRNLRPIVLAGVAGVAIAAAAFAAGRDMHMMNIDLPDGSVAHIAYKGDVAPRVSIAPAVPMIATIEDADDASRFGALDRIAMEMDHQAEALTRATRALRAVPFSKDGNLDLAAFGKLPSGTIDYRFVSTSDGSGTCERSVEVTSFGASEKPRVISGTLGDCKAARSTSVSARLDPPLPPAIPGLGRTEAPVIAGHARTDSTV